MNDTPPEDFHNMEDLLRKILSQAFGQGQIKPGVIGVNIIMAGNIPPGFPFPGSSNSGNDVRHPPIEVVEWDERVFVTCELKGLVDEHVNVAIAENTLHIIGFNGQIRYRSSVPLPPVVESSCTRSFQNGVLELVYMVRNPDSPDAVLQVQAGEPVQETEQTSNEDTS